MRYSKMIKKSDIVAFFLPFYYLLSQYKIGSLSLGMLSLAIISIVSIKNFSIIPREEYRPYLFFLVFIIVRDVLKVFWGYESVQEQVFSIIEYSLTFVFVFFICNTVIDEKKLYIAWKIAGLFYVVGLLYHAVMIYILGRSVSPLSIIPGYSLLEGSVFRPVSFFSEPAAFVNAIIPLLFLALKKNDYKWAIIVTLSIFLSTSSVGVVLSLVLWVSFFWVKRKLIKGKTFIVFVLLFIIIAYLYMDIFAESLNKLELVIAQGGSFGSRVLTGFEVVSTQTPLSLIFGTNYNTAMQYVSDHVNLFVSKVTYTYWLVGYVFMNTFSNLIFKYGIIGLALYINPLIARLLDKDYSAKPYVVSVLVAFLGQSMLLNSSYFLMVILVISFKCEQVDAKSISVGSYCHAMNDRL